VAWNNNSGALCNVAAAWTIMLHVAAVARYSATPLLMRGTAYFYDPKLLSLKN